MEKKPQYKVIVSDRARQMLAGHVRFLAQQSPSTARKAKNELMDAIRSLSTMPERYHLSVKPSKIHIPVP